MPTPLCCKSNAARFSPASFTAITLAAPLQNFAVVPLTAVIVPLGFLTLIAGYVFLAIGKSSWGAVLLGMVTQFLLHVCMVWLVLNAELPDTGSTTVVAILSRYC